MQEECVGFSFSPPLLSS